MTSQTESPKGNLFLHPMVVSAIIGAIALLIGAWIGSYSAKTPDPNTYEVTINPVKYPFEKTPVELQKGDNVEIMVLGAHSAILDCGLGATTVMGMVYHEYQRNAVLPTADLCAVIGRIGPESAPYFFVGAYTQFIADTSGTLFLGINDVAPGKCSSPDCFSNNTGTIFVRVAVRKK